MENSSDTIGNRTRALQACSTVPQPAAPPRTPSTQLQLTNTHVSYNMIYHVIHIIIL
jgi:hypothetical protein